MYESGIGELPSENGMVSASEGGANEELSKRKPNFTESEKLFLVRQYETYREVLSSRQIDVSSNRMKYHVWTLITEELNRRNPSVGRTPAEVRKKWQNLVTLARREMKEAEQRGIPAQQIPWIVRKVVDLSGLASGAMEEDETTFDITDVTGFGGLDRYPSPEAEGSSSRDPIIKTEPSWPQHPGAVRGGEELRAEAPPEPANPPPARTSPTFPMFPELQCPPISVPDSAAGEQAVQGADKPASVCTGRKRTRPTSPPVESCSKSADVAEKIQLERWSFEKAQKLQEIERQKIRFEFEKKKLALSTEMMELERDKLRLELDLKRVQARKQMENGFLSGI